MKNSKDEHPTSYCDREWNLRCYFCSAFQKEIIKTPIDHFQRDSIFFLSNSINVCLHGASKMGRHTTL